MTIEAKTQLNQIEIVASDVVQVRIALVLMNGDVELGSQWHRTAIRPGDDVYAQMDVVSKHLQQMGYPPVSPEDTARVDAHCKVTHTPEAIAKYKAAQEAVITKLNEVSKIAEAQSETQP